MIEARLLGPLEFSVAGVSVTPSARKPRQLLALLLLNANRMVPTSYLFRGLWDEAPPRSATTTLQTYILHLRRRLEMVTTDGSSKEIIATNDGGYTISVPETNLDVARYLELSRSGLADLQYGQSANAAPQLREALDLWQGDPLIDVSYSQLLRATASQLADSRLRTLEYRIDADLKNGRHLAVLDELDELTHQHPFHENFSLQYMVAHYLSGQRLMAMDRYHVLRRSLRDELGVEPSSRLRRLNDTILCGGSAVDVEFELREFLRG